VKGIATPAVAGEKAAEKKPAAAQMTDKAAASTGREAVEKKARKKGAEKADVQRQKILKEAVAALRETQNAIQAGDRAGARSRSGSCAG